MDCWFWNIDRSQQDFFARELQDGRLRQGWGYRENLNLRVIKKQKEASEPLTERQQAAWSRCRAMLTRIAPGDLAVVKNVPSSDHFSLVRVNGQYSYEISKETGDHGHILPVEMVGPFHKNAAAVSTPMVRALNREQHPIRRTLKHKEAVVNLADAEPGEAKEPEEFKTKIDVWRQVLAEKLKTLIHDSLDHRQAERLVLEMLRNDEFDVDWTAGPNERGADLETEALIGYGLSSDVAVQVKFHSGTESRLRGLEQIEQAFEERNTDAGLLVTFADELDPGVEDYLGKLKREHHENVEVLYGENLYLRLLELIADPDHAVEEL
jgi:hypothetical protein